MAGKAKEIDLFAQIRDDDALTQIGRVQMMVSVMLDFSDANPGLTRVMTGQVLMKEDPKLTERMTHLYDKLEMGLRQTLREAVLAQEVPANFDSSARAGLLMNWVLGRWLRFVMTSFAVRPNGDFLFRSLHMKLTLILLLLITSLMAVVGAFLTTSVTSFYIDSFYQQMSSAFGADRREFVADLRSAAAQPDGAERIQEIMEVNAGMLGIDYRTRNYYVLDGTAGSFLAGSAESSDLPREQSANLLTARNAVSRKDASTVGDESDISADYMDVAIPIFGGDNAYIIYILDNKVLSPAGAEAAQGVRAVQDALPAPALPPVSAHPKLPGPHPPSSSRRRWPAEPVHG